MTYVLTLLFVLVLLAIPVGAGSGILLAASSPAQGSGAVKVWEDGYLAVTLESKEGDVSTIHYEIGDLTWDTVLIEGKEYKIPYLGSESNIQKKGDPYIPTICRSIIIPDEAQMKARVTSAKYEDYEGAMIAPSRGPIPRTVDPEKVPFEFGDAYREDAWYPASVVDLGEPYILRDYRGQVVILSPVQYNPVRGTIRVYTEVTVEVYPEGPGDVNVIHRSDLPTSVVKEFKEIYQGHFLNFGLDRYTPVSDQGSMLVITYDSFADEMAPFVEWKNMKGIPTEMVNLSTIGSTATQIKNYIRDYYNANGLTFVLLVGDHQQVPTYVIWGYAASDPTYSYTVGTDHYPDLFVGRFSAQNATELSTQIERTITYERYPQADGTWYDKGTGIASDQGPGDDGEYDYQHIRNIRTDLMGFTYTAVDELYDGSQGGADSPGNPTISQVSGALNAGRSIINYCGHGWSQGWGTTGFDNDDVNALTNDNKLPFIWAVACDNGSFKDNYACFGEAWLRSMNGSAAAGAIAAFMSSISQYWNEPMDAQDEMNDILVESYANNVKRTFGGLSFNGCMLMNDHYGSSGWDMTDTWHVFGDPSVEVRTDDPATMTVQHDPTIAEGATSYVVEVPGVEDALCALSRDGLLLGYAYTDDGGYALIELGEPIAAGSDLALTITAFNMMPYEADVPVVPETGAVFLDDASPEFAVLTGTWIPAAHANAHDGAARFALAGGGEKKAGWRMDQTVAPGTYYVYVWKFEHEYQHLVASNAHYKVYHATGATDWILVDQSAPGNAWVLLGSFEFDASSMQGVLLTNEADGAVIADAVKLVPVP
jgi:hypothetical protein